MSNFMVLGFRDLELVRGRSVGQRPDRLLDDKTARVARVSDLVID